VRSPLAARLRPRTLDEFVGQVHLVGPGRALRRAIDSDRVGSMILWGPPGSGKTTLARLIAQVTSAVFESLSAVEAGIPDLRRIVAAARVRRDRGIRTVVFIDEVHRWTKTQQDAVMPHVEEGVITLIGATTENPSFEVNSALLSRCRVMRLTPLGDGDILEVLRRALASEADTRAENMHLDDDVLGAIVRIANGDARTALNALEAAIEAATLDDTGRRILTRATVEDAVQRRILAHDRAGDQHFDVVSAMIKSIRGSDPDAAVYWLARLLEAGEDPLFVARRLVILAAEDVGLASPQALSIAVAAQQATHFVGMPECVLPLTEAALFLALAPKSNSVLTTYEAAIADVRAHGSLPVPLHLRNAATRLMREMGFGRGYQYAHDYPEGRVAQQHLPDILNARQYYRPGTLGVEPRIAARPGAEGSGIPDSRDRAK